MTVTELLGAAIGAILVVVSTSFRRNAFYPEILAQPAGCGRFLFPTAAG